MRWQQRDACHPKQKKKEGFCILFASTLEKTCSNKPFIKCWNKTSGRRNEKEHFSSDKFRISFGIQKWEYDSKLRNELTSHTSSITRLQASAHTVQCMEQATRQILRHH
jgi:hypothetical protein